MNTSNEKIIRSGEFFNPTDVLECGQVFRYKPYERGYLVFSGDKACFLRSEGDKTVIECKSANVEYFYNYFDLSRDYSKIAKAACACGVQALAAAANAGKGVRILNQNPEEAILSFIISQNNNIPRIKKLIESLCREAGEKCEFFVDGEKIEYYSFPKISALLNKNEEFYASLGFGYRSRYMCEAAKALSGGFLNVAYRSLSSGGSAALKNELLKIKGVGEKVADCACLFGFHATDCFPVDVWIERVYKQFFGGELTDRKKISEYFVSRFKQNSGYFQQYLFYYKRTLEKRENSI